MKFYQIVNIYETYYSNLYIDKEECESNKINTDKILEVTLIEGIKNRLKVSPLFIILGLEHNE